eukprot:CAMPEP_0172493634 /NCGR_PEP_ID=MMETSP1066-20121228/25037_1 /TAXON_ID=671091 /ORGANISM="Coscinodiscus wailesii, Strain CCMP2513" /LENGTH=878 /DNA_ID=CAMNT_0013263857 /DNA_START=100 /DNA_END=2736 /DNA_ORIENTATION=+
MARKQSNHQNETYKDNLAETTLLTNLEGRDNVSSRWLSRTTGEGQSEFDIFKFKSGLMRWQARAHTTKLNRRNEGDTTDVATSATGMMERGRAPSHYHRHSVIPSSQSLLHSISFLEDATEVKRGTILEDEDELRGSTAFDSHIDEDEEIGKNETDLLLAKPPKSSKRLSWGQKLCFRIRRQLTAALYAIRPKVIRAHVSQFLLKTVLLIMVPAMALASFLFYYVNNVEVVFFPAEASLSWWLVFLVRQLVTFNLAKAFEYVIVQVMALRGHVWQRLFGPLTTLFLIQAQGWPFRVAVWGILDLFLLHGDSPFIKNWLYKLQIPLLSAEHNPDDGILMSETYLGVLLSLVLLGSAWSVKRTVIAWSSMRRNFDHFEEKLEKLLGNMILVAEVSYLAWEASHSDGRPPTIAGLGEHIVGGITKELSKMDDSEGDDDEDEDDDEDGGEGKDVKEDAAKDTACITRMSTDSISTVHGSKLQSQRMCFRKLKSRLEAWEVPKSKSDQCLASHHDILRFRKMVALMNENEPFSSSFGPANDRDSCIKSARHVFHKLLFYAPRDKAKSTDKIPFSVMATALAEEENGEIDNAKIQDLRRLFHPDKDDYIDELSFVQACDHVYKKMRYLRASIGNAFLIDNMLEDIVDVICAIVITLAIIALMRYNPYKLLLSMTSLMVSFAFAIGPSVAKYIEGVVMIAVRRPYDLGDRITFCDANNIGGVPTNSTWFVEDISLFSTKLRFAPSNELSTVNNGSIANSRIQNLGRSVKALVTIWVPLRVETSHSQIEAFRVKLEAYLADNPCNWARLIHFRVRQIDSDTGLVEYQVRVQHVKSWQNLGAVQLDKGNLIQFCYDLSKKMNINYLSNPRRMKVAMNEVDGRDLPVN